MTLQIPRRRAERRGLRLWNVGLVLALAFTAAVLVAGFVFYAGWDLLGARQLQKQPKLDSKTLFDLVKLSFGVVAGAGALVALVVAYRRQRVDEDGALRDATRLHTERFTTAVSQLGDDSPAVRLGGVHALAGLADDAPTRELRQTCVDVLCAYLRLPYTAKADLPVGDTGARHAYLSLREVRHTVIRLIRDHLRLPPEHPHTWSHLHLDFTGVVFDGGDFSRAVFRGRVEFTGAVFSAGTVDFGQAVFSGGLVTFTGAKFCGSSVHFNESEFSGGTVSFVLTKFSSGKVHFHQAKFSGSTVYFYEAKFSGGSVSFFGARFLDGTVDFEKASFSGSTVNFSEADFSSAVIDFQMAEFSDGMVNFVESKFSGGTVNFFESKFYGSAVDFHRARFYGSTVNFACADFAGGRVAFFQGTFSGGTVDFAEARFSGGMVDFTQASGLCPAGLIRSESVPGLRISPLWSPG
ncbi:pentapeptide repeat-containing protein [Streptomyces sp. cmx-10-25]|uniref:pentapeptide repeat-containing protein n=1 Tax=Streptomyces sp. cmx-10-25 TaxID=2790919 RepID=UPI00397E99DE